MNKINFLLILTVSVIVTFTSCADEENSSEATVSYMGQCNNVNYLDPSDSIYGDLIVESLDHFKIAGPNSYFTESATTTFNSTQLAVIACNTKADSTYKSLLQKYDLQDVKDYIFNTHKDSLKLSSSDDLSLDEFYVSLSLQNSYNIAVTIGNYHKTFK